MSKIKVAGIGVGNCFSALVQAVEYYKRKGKEPEYYVVTKNIGSYSIRDIEFVCAFDISERKIGKSIGEAIYEYPNLVRWVKEVKCEGKVYPAPILDGVGKWVVDDFSPHKIEKSIDEWKEEIRKIIEKEKPDVLVNLLPVGSDEATKFWAEIALETKIPFINAIPSFIASKKEWAEKFEKKTIPIIGDDMKGQIGATILHRWLMTLLKMRNCKIENTYQLNIGGNTDFKNMLERERLKSKKVSKTEAVRKIAEIGTENVSIGPSDYIPFLGNTKIMYVYIHGRQIVDVPFEIDVKLKVDDKANSTAILVDAIRIIKLAKEKGIGGVLKEASLYLMKHPPEEMLGIDDEKAREMLLKWIEKAEE